jgi:hypothetical protein
MEKYQRPRVRPIRVDLARLVLMQNLRWANSVREFAYSGPAISIATGRSFAYDLTSRLRRIGPAAG